MDSDWFEIKKLPGDIYAIMEPYHFQDIISYLIIGSRAAVLFDTGAGIADIRKAIGGLYDGEIIAVNSHVHFDHVGGNHLFDKVLIYNHPPALNRLKKGYSAAELSPHAKPALFAPGKMGDFDPGKYVIMPSNPHPIEDGHVIDLGSRRLQVMHTPGHSPDSIMLLDDLTSALFTGDSYYPAPIYCHYEGEFYGASCLEDFARSLAKVSAIADDLKTLHPGHNRPTAHPSELKKAAQAMSNLLNGKIGRYEHLYGDLTVASLPDSGENVPGYVVPDDLFIYDFDGVKIISRKRH